MKRKLIGQGTYSNIFKYGQDTVVKVPTKKYTFINEICVMNSLNHPNLIRAVDTFVENDRILIVSDLAISDLKIYMQNNKLTDGNKLYLTDQLCQAVKYLHRLGWLHLDLKVTNVLIFPGLIAKITDFGFVIPVDSRGQRRVSHPVCSPMTLPPENRKSKGGLFGYYSDIWCLGIMIAEIYTNGTKRELIPRIREDSKYTEQILTEYRTGPRILRRLIRMTLVGYKTRPSATECCKILGTRLDDMSWSSGINDAWPMPHANWLARSEIYDELYTHIVNLAGIHKISVEALFLTFNYAIRVNPDDYEVETLARNCIYIASLAVNRGKFPDDFKVPIEVQLEIIQTLNYVSYQCDILPDCGCNYGYRLISSSLKSAADFMNIIKKLPDHKCQGKVINAYSPVKSVISF